MPETLQRNYQSISDMAQERPRVGKKFFVCLAGNTKGAHEDIVNKFKSIGQIEVQSQEESDYVLVFCPIVSRAGTDTKEALSKVHADKPAVLMVMHHTFDRDHVVMDSRRLVDEAKVPLTADFFFYEGKLLNSCDRNEIAFHDIQKFFGVTPFQASRFGLPNIPCTPSRWFCCLIVLLAVILIVVLVVTYVIIRMTETQDHRNTTQGNMTDQLFTQVK